MTFLIVGLDRKTLAPWHRNVRERDAASAARTALTLGRSLGGAKPQRAIPRATRPRRRARSTAPTASP
jgi:hypothetical protein